MKTEVFALPKTPKDRSVILDKSVISKKDLRDFSYWKIQYIQFSDFYIPMRHKVSVRGRHLATYQASGATFKQAMSSISRFKKRVNKAIEEIPLAIVLLNGPVNDLIRDIDYELEQIDKFKDSFWTGKAKGRHWEDIVIDELLKVLVWAGKNEQRRNLIQEFFMPNGEFHSWLLDRFETAPISLPKVFSDDGSYSWFSRLRSSLVEKILRRRKSINDVHSEKQNILNEVEKKIGKEGLSLLPKKSLTSVYKDCTSEKYRENWPNKNLSSN